MKIKIPVTVHPGDEVELDALLIYGDWAVVNSISNRQPIAGRYQVVSIDEGLSACYEDLELMQACRYIKTLPPKADSGYPSVTNAWDAFCKSEGIKPRRTILRK